MNKFELSQSISTLCSYYERKQSTTGTVEIWWEKVKPIPAEALKWIENQIMSSNDAFPKNLPGTMWACFRSWQEANPNKIARPGYEIACPDDCNNGLIHVRKDKDFGEASLTYTYVFACAKCNKGPLGYPHARLRDLLADGYVKDVQQPHGAAYYRRLRDAKAKGVEAVVGDVVKALTGGISQATREKFAKAGLPMPSNGVESSRYKVAIEKTGVETSEEPSDEEIARCGAF